MAKKLLFQGTYPKISVFLEELFLEAPFTKVFWTYLESAQNFGLFDTHKSILKRKKLPLFLAHFRDFNFFKQERAKFLQNPRMNQKTYFTKTF